MPLTIKIDFYKLNIRFNYLKLFK